MSEWDRFLERARANAKKTSIPPTWNPKNVADFIYGVVVDEVPNPWDSSITSYIIRTPDGQEYTTPRNAVLVAALKRNPPRIGSKIYICYVGTGKGKPGKNPPKIFEIYIEHPEQQVQPPEVSTAAKVAESEEKPPTGEARPDEKLEKYLRSLATVYVGTVSWKMLQKHLEARGIYMDMSEVKKLPEMFPDILEVVDDGKKVRFKK